MAASKRKKDRKNGRRRTAETNASRSRLACIAALILTCSVLQLWYAELHLQSSSGLHRRRQQQRVSVAEFALPSDLTVPDRPSDRRTGVARNVAVASIPNGPGTANDRAQQDSTGAPFDHRRLLLPFNTSIHVPTHNTTVDGRPIPGSFHDRMLYLLGARLTTSYETDNRDVLVTLFGFPGDFWTRFRRRVHRCRGPHPLNGTLLTFLQVEQRFDFFTVLHCRGCNENDATEPIPMELVPGRSTSDRNQREGILTWNANITSWISRSHIEEADRSSRTPDGGTDIHRLQSLRVHFFIHDRNRSGVTQNVVDSNADQGTVRHLKRLATLDIPLSTRAVGVGGPQIGKIPKRDIYAKDISHSNGSAGGNDPNKTAVSPTKGGITLCVQAYGEASHRYLPQFVQHHLNLQFDHIVVGIQDYADSYQVRAAERVLSPFLEEGTVVISPTVLPGLDCEVDISAYHFYNGCLFHAKGLTEYVGVWDLDELWMPPYDRRRENIVPSSPSLEGTLSQHVIDRLKQDDDWLRSRYRNTVNIVHAMRSVEAYQSFYGCGESWCYHNFPSIRALRRLDAEGNRTRRTFRYSKDFDFVKDRGYDMWWSKGVSRTKMVFMGGVHIPGACKLSPQDGLYMHPDWIAPQQSLYDTEFANVCRNLRTGGFGDMLHHVSLFQERGYDDVPRRGKRRSGYVQLFAETVETQLRKKGLLDPDGVPVEVERPGR